jgi:hypothetical protein
LRYEPVSPDPLLAGHLQQTTDTGIASADGTLFDITVTIDNAPYTAGIQTSADVPEVNCRFKEITIEATPHNTQAGWITALKTKVVFQRVRLIN